MSFPIPVAEYEYPAPQQSKYIVQDFELPWDEYQPQLNGGDHQTFAEIWPFIYTKPEVPRPMIVRFKGYWNLLASASYPQKTQYEVQTIKTVSQTTSLKEELSAKLTGAAKGITGEISGSITKETTVEVVNKKATTKTFHVPGGQAYRYVSWQWCVDYAFVYPGAEDRIMYWPNIQTSLRNGENADCTIGVPNWITCRTSQTHTQNIIYDIHTGKVLEVN